MVCMLIMSKNNGTKFKGQTFFIVSNRACVLVLSVTDIETKQTSKKYC